MGMFDYIRYQGHEYQTKDTPRQLMDNYEIRDDGTLWYENYDGDWMEDDDKFFGGYYEKKNVRWEPLMDFDGLIRFYRAGANRDTWIEYKALFMDGKIIKFTEATDEKKE